MTELICRLDRRRFEVHVVCMRREGQWLSRVEDVAASVSEFPVRGFRSAGAVVQLLRFARWCTTQRIAIVHACDFYANIFALTGAALARVPVRIGSRRDIRLPQRSDSQHRLQQISYRFAHRVVANSRAAAAQLQSEGVPDAAIAMIPNGIDASRYESAEPRAARRVITTVANLRGEKGHDVLLQAAAIVRDSAPDVVFQIVGEGPMGDALVAQADALGVSSCVRFLGHREDIPAILRDSDLFILPSRTEAFPNGLLEAMAAGLPVIASDVGGIPELVDHGRNGLLVPVADANALASAVLQLVREPAHAARLGSAARQTIETRYSFERMVAAFEELYRESLKALDRTRPMSNGLPIGEPSGR